MRLLGNGGASEAGYKEGHRDALLLYPPPSSRSSGIRLLVDEIEPIFFNRDTWDEVTVEVRRKKLFQLEIFQEAN